MQITLNQDEVTKAVKESILSRISFNPDQLVEVDFTAGRAPNGLTAVLTITDPVSATDTAAKPVPRPAAKLTSVTRTPDVEPESEPTPNDGDDSSGPEEEELSQDQETESKDNTEDAAPPAPTKSIFSKKSA